MAQVAYANELFELFGDECVRMSVDDKNKINVGTLAVSRFFQIQKFFPVNDAPNYNDHDFPYPDSKIVPSGYLVMQSKEKGDRYRCCRSQSPPPRRAHSSRRTRSLLPIREPSTAGCRTSVDKSGRQHVNYRRTGNLYVFNHAVRFAKTSAQTLANDLLHLLADLKVAEGKKAVLLVSDNGPDWNPKFLQTFLCLGRLWRDLKLDVLVQTSYAAGFSRYNMVERAWAPLSWKLVGVTLPATLEGESLPPWQQTGIPEAEQRAKEIEVFDDAMAKLNQYWSQCEIDGFSVHPIAVPCLTSTPDKYSDEETVRSFLKAGVQEHATITKSELQAF